MTNNDLSVRIAMLEKRLADMEAMSVPRSLMVKTKIIGDLEWQDELVPKMSWDNAVEYAKSLGEGWRLPTVQELVSLWDYDKGCCPSFTDANGWYWSSSPFDSGDAWNVNFDNGNVRNRLRLYEYGVRCVRSTKR